MPEEGVEKDSVAGHNDGRRDPKSRDAAALKVGETKEEDPHYSA